MEVTRHAQSTENRNFVIFLQYKKKILMKFIFCMQINVKVSYKLILTLWMSLVRPNQSTRNSFVWLDAMHQKVAILNKGKSANFLVKLV